MSFSSFNPEGEPTVIAALASEYSTDDTSIPYEASPRYGSVHLGALNPKTREVLAKFDRNRDGQVDADELENVINTLVKEKFKNRLFLLGILMVLFALVILLTCGSGLTWAVVRAYTGTGLRGSVLITSDSGKAIGIANSDFTIRNQVLVTHSHGGVSISTAPLVRWRTLNANMTTDMLNTLVRIMINSTATESRVGFKVTGFSLSGGNPQKLLVNTPAGTLLVKGDVLEGVDAATNLLNPNELKGAGVLGVFYDD